MSFVFFMFILIKEILWFSIVIFLLKLGRHLFCFVFPVLEAINWLTNEQWDCDAWKTTGTSNVTRDWQGLPWTCPKWDMTCASNLTRDKVCELRGQNGWIIIQILYPPAGDVCDKVSLLSERLTLCYSVCVPMIHTLSHLYQFCMETKDLGMYTLHCVSLRL